MTAVRVASPRRPRRAALRLAFLAVVAVATAGCQEEPEPVTNPRSLSLDSPFEYPLELWDRRVEGETVVMVYVTDVGAVDSVYVLEPSGEAAFDSAAVQGARTLKFAPGRRGDRRIAMWARLPVLFTLPDTTNPGATP